MAVGFPIVTASVDTIKEHADEPWKKECRKESGKDEGKSLIPGNQAIIPEKKGCNGSGFLVTVTKHCDQTQLWEESV